MFGAGRHRPRAKKGAMSDRIGELLLEEGLVTEEALTEVTRG